MKYGCVCSGISAPTVAWTPLGWKPAFFSEIEPFPSAVLAHHYPDVQNRGDMSLFSEWPDESIDLLVAGTPCQSFSVAGLRKGLDDPRGNLALIFIGVVEKYRPCWVVWENVPGVLSSNRGQDFGAFLGALGELGYGWAYRCLDAQWFGLAQRRKRVFVVAHSGDWRRAAAVLFEPEGLRGDSSPSREAGEDIAPTISARPTGGGGLGTDFDCDGGLGLIPSPGCWWDGGQVSQTLDAVLHKGQTMPEKNRFPAVLVPVDITNGNMGGDVAGTLGTEQASGNRGQYVAPAVAFQSSQSGVRQCDTHPTLDGNNGSRRHNGVIQDATVRRLTPRECERLMGFPDDYTAVPYRGKTAADGPRYKALGNSMAVPVVRWIGERIQLFEGIDT